MNIIDRRKALLFFLTVFLSRLPFLFDGFGSEEDAWALPLVAERIAETGEYEVSRLPGHPFQEIIYSTVWWMSPAFYNLITALISSAGILAFVLFLRQLHSPHPWLAGTALAFTPVVYIHSTNAMDYTWALAFSMGAAYFIARRRLWPAAGLLALAAGCRITAMAMALPCCLLLYSLSEKHVRLKDCILFALLTVAGTAAVYLPVILTYGSGFFTWYEHFPIPGFIKNTYKGTLAVWGLPGILALATTATGPGRKAVKALWNTFRSSTDRLTRGLLWFGFSGMILYLTAFVRLPLKAAFMVPFVPFLIAVLFHFTARRTAMNLTAALVLSCFTFGVNLADSHRGSSASGLALTFTISGHPVAIDPLNGLITADRSKRINRTAFAGSVLRKTKGITEKTVIIAGWWLADLQYLERANVNPSVVFRHYIDESELRWLQRNGYKIFFLEDQDTYNDLRYNKKMTKRYADQLVL